MKIEYNNHAWNCPKCGDWRRVKGVGEIIRKCKCGYKAIVVAEVVIEKTYDTHIIDVKEIKKEVENDH